MVLPPLQPRQQQPPLLLLLQPQLQHLQRQLLCTV
jgi:hypothetical protein